MSTDRQAEGFKTLLSAATKVPVYDLDEAQDLGAGKPANYVILYLERRFGGTTRLVGLRSNRLRRLSTRVVALTVTNARLLEDRIAATFARSVTVDGATLRVNYESGGGAFEYDEGFYTDLTDWTYST